MDVTERLGQRLRARRSELGLTLAAVAFDAGLSVPYIANLEKGRGNPTLDVIVGLAAALRLSPDSLLDGDASQELVDVVFAELPAVLVDYARGRSFPDTTERIAAELSIPVDEMRIVLLRAMAHAPRPFGRELAMRDCERLLDAYLLIVIDSQRQAIRR